MLIIHLKLKKYIFILLIRYFLLRETGSAGSHLRQRYARWISTEKAAKCEVHVGNYHQAELIGYLQDGCNLMCRMIVAIAHKSLLIVAGLSEWKILRSKVFYRLL